MRPGTGIPGSLSLRSPNICPIYLNLGRQSLSRNSRVPPRPCETCTATTDQAPGSLAPYPICRKRRIICPPIVFASQIISSGPLCLTPVRQEFPSILFQLDFGATLGAKSPNYQAYQAYALPRDHEVARGEAPPGQQRRSTGCAGQFLALRQQAESPKGCLADHGAKSDNWCDAKLRAPIGARSSFCFDPPLGRPEPPNKMSGLRLQEQVFHAMNA